MNSQIFSPTLSELPKIMLWLRDRIAPTLLSNTEKKRVELALEEAIVNVITHSKGEPSLTLTLICRYEPYRQIEFDICDNAPPFNPMAAPLPSEAELHAPLEEREEGGLGLVLMREVTDALFYRRENEQNILTLIKNVPPSQGSKK